MQADSPGNGSALGRSTEGMWVMDRTLVEGKIVDGALMLRRPHLLPPVHTCSCAPCCALLHPHCSQVDRAPHSPGVVA